MQTLFEQCDIYFEGALISRELLLRNYADFIARSFEEKERLVGITLHTGSICFDIIALLAAAIGTLILDESDLHEVIESLKLGAVVQYDDRLYYWAGFCNANCESVPALCDATHFRLEKQDKDKNVVYYPMKHINHVLPYNGDAQVRGGKGGRQSSNKRREFLSTVFSVAPSEVANLPTVSSVIVADRDTAKRLYSGISIRYGKGKEILLSEIATASYYTDDDEHRFSGNPGRIEPLLKVARGFFRARELILGNDGNRSVGLFVFDSDGSSGGDGELQSLINMPKALKYIMISKPIAAKDSEVLLTDNEDAEVFACTREVLLTQAGIGMENPNPITTELASQIDRIINNQVVEIRIPGLIDWEEYRQICNIIRRIQVSDWREDDKEEFVRCAYSLLKLFTTAIFSMERLESAIREKSLRRTVGSPRERIDGLILSADNAPSYLFESVCNVVIGLERIYNQLHRMSAKQGTLENIISNSDGKVAVVVPKEYYIDIVAEILNHPNLTIVTANRFDSSCYYDKVVVVGDFTGKRFDALRCIAAADIIVLLYDYEFPTFHRKKQLANCFERKLEKRTGLTDEEETDIEEDEQTVSSEEEVDETQRQITALDEMFSRIGDYDVRHMIGTDSLSEAGAVTTVVAVGGFTNGMRILFSKQYKALVFDGDKGTVKETDVADLATEDTLVFTRNDSLTHNIVDDIFDALRHAGKLSVAVLRADELAKYWRLALKEYADKERLSPKDVATQLALIGAKRDASTVRVWMDDENCHIIGPHDIEAYEAIALLTQDAEMLSSPKRFHEACRTVRHERRKILDLIGQAIIEKLRGTHVGHNDILDVVFSNVERLADCYELEQFSRLDNPIEVPMNKANRPILTRG